MKIAVIFTLQLIAFLVSPAAATLCTTTNGIYVGNLILPSQSDVNAAFSCTHIQGGLEVRDNNSCEDDVHNNIIDLSPLDNLQIVDDYLSICYNNELINITDGFPSLTVVKGIFVENNPSLQTFSGFNAVTTIGDYIEFSSGNDSLETIDGFDSLVNSGQSISFESLKKVTKLPDFKSLKTIGSSLFIGYNAELVNVSGFEALENIKYSLSIYRNPKLASIYGMHNYFNHMNGNYTGYGAFDVDKNDPGLPASLPIFS